MRVRVRGQAKWRNFSTSQFKLTVLIEGFFSGSVAFPVWNEQEEWCVQGQESSESSGKSSDNNVIIIRGTAQTISQLQGSTVELKEDICCYLNSLALNM